MDTEAGGNGGAGLVSVARHVAGAVQGVLARRAEVDEMLDEAMPGRPVPRTPLVVAIDGRSGAGKTLLARALLLELRANSAAPDAQILALEDLYRGWHGLQGGLDAARELLSAVGDGRVGRAPRWDWVHGRYDGDVVVGEAAPGGDERVALPTVLVLEGCGAGSDTLAAYVDLLVWIEVPEERRRRRSEARDGQWDISWEEWARAEAELLSRRDAPTFADLVVGTADDA